MKKDKLMFKLKPDFQKDIFGRIMVKYGGAINAEKILKIKRVSIRGYKNLYFKSVPERVIEKLIVNKIITSEELKNNTISTFKRSEQIAKSLDMGRLKIKGMFSKLKKRIPPLKDVMSEGYLDFSLWLKNYRTLECPFRKLKIEENEDYYILKYCNFAKTGFKNFEVNIPKRFVLDDDFVYFFGLWCGDRVGGKRFGICNQNEGIINFTENFLNKYNQKIERILYITKNQKEPKINYDKKFISNNDIKGWVLSVHSNNGVLASFFYYLQNNLDEFLKGVRNKKMFFAGLFDAEGNVSIYNRSFRWACKDKEKIYIYTRHLMDLNLYYKYDGSSLVTYNIKGFYEKIVPYLKHSNKRNDAIFLYKGEGILPEDYFIVLEFVNKTPKMTAKEIAKALKKGKVYQELKILSDFNFIAHEGYPYKFKVTPKGLKSLGASKS